MMKKGLAMLLCVLTLLLCACSGQQAEDTTPPASTGGAPAQSTAAPTSGDSEAFTKAQSCIDKSVEELYALIGQPTSSDYASSCLGAGEDGNLYYDGFIVYTYREGSSETVRFVEKSGS